MPQHFKTELPQIGSLSSRLPMLLRPGPSPRHGMSPASRTFLPASLQALPHVLRALGQDGNVQCLNSTVKNSSNTALSAILLSLKENKNAFLKIGLLGLLLGCIVLLTMKVLSSVNCLQKQALDFQFFYIWFHKIQTLFLASNITLSSRVAIAKHSNHF